MKRTMRYQQRKVLTSQEQRDIVQPLAKDGYSSDDFDKIYGKKKNPYADSDRHRKNKRKWKFITGNPLAKS